MMKVLLVGAALMLIFVTAMLFLVSERKNSGQQPPGRFQVTGYVTGDFADTPWAGTVAKLGTEQALIPPSGRFNFAVPPGRYPLGVCCSSEFQVMDQIVEVVNHDVELQVVAQPLIAVSGTISVIGRSSSLQGFAISAARQGTNVVNRAVSDADGHFDLRLSGGRWNIRIENLPEGYSKPELLAGGARVENDVLVVAPLPKTISLEVRLTGRS